MKGMNHMKKETIRTARNGRFNIIDLLIILGVLALCATIIYVYFSDFTFDKKSEKATITYSIRFSGINESFISAISEGDAVVDEKGYALGTVVSADTFEAHKDVIYDSADKKVVSVPYPSLIDLTVKIKVDADANSETGYTVNGKRIAVGAEYSLSMPGFEGCGICVDIIENSSDGGVK